MRKLQSLTLLILAVLAATTAGSAQAADMAAPPNSLTVDDTGKVGVGTAAPTAALHVQRSDGVAKVLVQETNGTPTDRQLFQIENNGRTHFRMIDTTGAADKTWDFLASGAFFISRIGSGATEFLLDGSGNLTINGALSQGSSREKKMAIKQVDAESVLDKVLSLPISEWSYKHDGEKVRHMGPMAEDFADHFGLGSNSKDISSIDTSGVALAAIKGLNHKLADKDKEIATLRQEIAQLRALVEQVAAKDKVASQ